MASDPWSPAAEAFPVAGADVAEDLRLLRRYEPVLRFTQGELFLPMPVEAYLEDCELWRSPEQRRRAGRRNGERLNACGELTVARLAQAGTVIPARRLWLRFVQRPLSRKEYRAWRRDPGRPRAAKRGSRLAAVGLLARLIDALMRLSLLLRGRVPAVRPAPQSRVTGPATVTVAVPITAVSSTTADTWCCSTGSSMR